jgi:hypothetical protein
LRRSFSIPQDDDDGFKRREKMKEQNDNQTSPSAASYPPRNETFIPQQCEQRGAQWRGLNIVITSHLSIHPHAFFNQRYTSQMASGKQRGEENPV